MFDITLLADQLIDAVRWLETAHAYRDALTEAGTWDKLHQILDGLDKSRVEDLGVFDISGGRATN